MQRTSGESTASVQRAPIGWALGAIVAAVILVAIISNTRQSPPAESTLAVKPQAKPDAAPESDATADRNEQDGNTQWASPTHGQPLNLAGLPPGVQVILALRPKEMLAHPEAEKIIAALGPLGARGIERIASEVDRPLEEIDLLLVGWTIDRKGHWQASIVRAEAVNSAPPLTRDLERLVAHTDASRQVTLLVRPSFLFGDGNAVFEGPLAALRTPLYWFLGDHLSAAALSANWDHNFFVEFVGVPTLDVPPREMAEILKTRVEETPSRVARFVATLAWSPFARQVVARFPQMLQMLAAYTRADHDRDVVRLRAYLPVEAGHNLIMGSELTLAEALVRLQTDSTVVEANLPLTIEQRLRQTTSLRFSRDTLETALKMLSDDIGVPIVIRGADLQLEGITKNQSFAIDLSERPADEILVEILRLANPDRLATGPADPRQKLVYTLGHDPATGRPAVIITTRTQATTRNETLPAPFVTTASSALD